MKGTSLDSLFAPGERGEIAELVSEVTGSVIPMVVGVGGETAAGQTLDLELMALPLRHRGRTQARLLGSLAALDVPYWVGTVPVERLRIVSARRLYPGLVPLDYDAKAASHGPAQGPARRPSLVLPRLVLDEGHSPLTMGGYVRMVHSGRAAVHGNERVASRR